MNLNVHAYNASIALNNAGAQLIQRRMPLEAFLTMQDALRLMRQSFMGSCDEEENGADASLQAAWKRTSVSNVPEENKNLSFEKQIMTITDQDNPAVVYDTLLRKHDAFCVIKIDPVECFAGCDDRLKRLEIETSIILYNYAIVCHCFAEALGDSVDEVVRKSMVIMKLAQLEATTIWNDSMSYSGNPMDIPPSILLVSMLVEDMLLHISAFQEALRGPINPYADNLHVILTTILKRDMVLSKEGYGLLSVAPAA